MRTKDEQDFRDEYVGKVLHVRVLDVTPGIRKDWVDMDVEFVETGLRTTIEVNLEE